MLIYDYRLALQQIQQIHFYEIKTKSIFIVK